jgi:hypothetical protein
MPGRMLMVNWCERLRPLQGERLETTKDAEPFHVVLVDNRRVKIEVGKDRTSYSINCGQFTKAEKHRLLRGDVERQELQDAGIAGGRTSYAAAIIREVFRRGL